MIFQKCKWRRITHMESVWYI